MNFKLFTALTLISFNLIAQTRKVSASNASPGYIGVGILSYETGAAATSATSGQKAFFGQTFYQLHISKVYNWNNLKIAPLFQYGLIANKSPDGQQKSNVSSIGARALFYPSSSLPQLNWHVGTGLQAYRIQNKAGTVTLNNGNSTMDFGTSGDAKSSTYIYIDVGVGYKVDKNRFDLALLTTKITDNEKRAVSTALSYSREVF